ncbi:MAG: hypothetical protein E7461_07335 [Ruminococcaceae bacterium]|nr:hypothetical protein [Oscillospiraceae bacterium]
MKKWIVVMILLLLTGCTPKANFETVGDVYAPENLTPCDVTLTLPAEASVQTITGEGGRLYLCDGYSVTVQTLIGGDLEKTIEEVTGFSPQRLTLLETEKEGLRLCRCVWTSAGEGGDQIAQTLILNDGNFHYAVTAMAPSEKAAALSNTWQEIFRSVKLVN